MNQAITGIEKMRKLISWILAAMLIIGLLSSVINLKYILIIGLVMIMLAFMMGTFYGLFMKGLSTIERIIIFAMSLILLIRFIFSVQHWKGAGIAQIALIIPMLLFIYVSFKMPGKLKFEFPFILLMAIFALLSFFGI
jgi:hypothetical protein